MKSPQGILSFLSRRFLLSKKQEGFLSFITFVSVLSVTLGVLALVSVTSVINGFRSELKNVLNSMNGDVVFYTRGRPIAEPEYIEERIKKLFPEVQGMTQTFVTELMLSGPEGRAGAVLEGIDLKTISQATRIHEKIIEGELAKNNNEVTLGFELAHKIGAKIGDEVRLIVPFAGAILNPEDGVQSSIIEKKTVVGIFKMGMHDFDSKFFFAPLESVQNLLKLPQKITSLKLKFPESSDTRRISVELRSQFGYPFQSKDWSEMNQNLFYAIELEKKVITIILAAIILVAAFNTVCTLMMMIHDKTKEISILKAMGLTKRQSFLLFVRIGMFIGGAGTAIGVVLGLLVNQILKKFKFIDLPPEVYHLGFLPVKEVWSELALIVFVALLICFCSTLYPSFVVAKRSPLDGIRYE